MNASECRLASLDALRVVSSETPRALVVLMHGYAMRPQDLEPFAHSLGLPAVFYFPRGPQETPDGARAWWSIDEEKRDAEIALGERDVFDGWPANRPHARAALVEFLDAARALHSGLPLVLCGFSQGGMLACDTVLCAGQDVAALAMLSSSRIAFADWIRHRDRLVGLPVLVSHGLHDASLSFVAGERLRDFCIESGARVTWQPFDGAHEIPLVVWRALRRFLTELALPRT
jgi:phospholipase/carboxylesterase